MLIEFIVIYLLSFNAELLFCAVGTQPQSVQIPCKIGPCAFKGICEIGKANYSCVGCYSGFYEYPEHNCEEIEYCINLKQSCDENGECLPMWGNGFCKCREPYIGRFCDRAEPKITQMSKPEFLFNLDPNYQSQSSLILFFEGGVGTDFRFDITVADTYFQGQAKNLIEAVPKQFIKNTDLAAITPLIDKLPNVKKKMYHISLQFKRERTRKIKLTLSNAGVVQYDYEYQISAVGTKYCYPKVFIRDCPVNKSEPAIKRRNERIVFRASAFPVCGKTQSGRSQLLSTWHLHRLSKQYPVSSKLNEITTTEKGNNTHFVIAPFTLNYGLHALKLFVEEAPAKPTDKQPGLTPFVCWIRVAPKPIKTIIAGGTEKVVGFGQAISLDASEIVDENEPIGSDTSYINISWSCTPTIQSASVDLAAFKGKILTLNPGSVKTGTYNFTVTVNVDVNKAPTIGDFPESVIVPESSSASQIINVVAGNITLLSILCVKNCGTPETINIHDVIYFTAQCLDECEGSNVTQGYYEWSANNDLQLNTKTTEYGNDAARLIIKGDVVQPDVTYTITVVARYKGSRRGRASITLKVNSPLILGDDKCSITPEEGISGKTRFNLNCTFPKTYLGFPVRYEIYQRALYDDPNSEILLSYLNDPTRKDLMLSAGDPNDGYKTYVTIQAVDYNNIQIKKENVVSIKVKNLFEDPDLDVENEVLNIIEDADEYAEERNIPELLRLITSVKTSMEKTPNKTGILEDKMRPKFVDYIDGIPLMNQQVSTQAVMALHVVLEAGKGDGAKPVSHETIEVAANILKKVSTKLHEGVVSTEGITNEDLIKVSQLVVESTDMLLSNMKNSLQDFDAVSPKGVAPMEPLDKETGKDYSDYSDLDNNYLKNRKSYEKASVSILLAMDDVAKAIGAHMAVGEKEKIINSTHMTSYVKVDRPELLAGVFLSAGDGEGVIISKELASLIQKDVEFIEIHVTVTDRNPFAWDPESRDINTKLLIVTIRNRLTGKEIEFKKKKPVQIIVHSLQLKDDGCVLCTGTEHMTNGSYLFPEKVVGEISVPLKSRNDKKILNKCMRVYKVRAKKGLKPYLLFEQPSKQLRIAVGVNLRPSLEDMNLYSQTVAETVHVEGVALTDHEYFYIAILPHSDALAAAPQSQETLDVSYSFLVLLVGCRSWNVIRMRWNSEGCEAGPDTVPEKLHCICDHLSAFMGSIFVVPALAEDFQDMNVVLVSEKSYIVCQFVMLILILSLLLFPFTYWLDRRSKPKAMLVILDDNIPGEEYAYLVGVYTGNCSDAATTAHISFQMTGAMTESKVYLLTDRNRGYVWARNSDNWFIVYTSSWLGNLRFITLWHDSSGHDPTWFCEKILVHDVQKDEIWVFLVQRYLSVIYGDGMIFCVIEPASREEIKNRKILFRNHLNICFREEHMWLSVFRRHPRSNFTSTQRLAVCTCYIMLCMLISITLFGIPSKNPAAQIFTKYEGIFWREMLVICSTNFLAIAAILPVILLFRKTGPQEGKPRDIEEKPRDKKCICCPCAQEDNSNRISSSPISSRHARGYKSSTRVYRRHHACYHRCQVCCHRHIPTHPGRCCAPIRDNLRKHRDYIPHVQPVRTHLPSPKGMQVATARNDIRKRQHHFNISASFQVKCRNVTSGKISCHYQTTFRNLSEINKARENDFDTEALSISSEEPGINFNKSYIPEISAQLKNDEVNKVFVKSEDEDEPVLLYEQSSTAISWAEYTKEKLSRAKYVFLDLIMMDPLFIGGTWKKSEDKEKQYKQKTESDGYKSTIPRYWFRHHILYWAWLLCGVVTLLCSVLVCRIGLQCGHLKSWRWILLMIFIILFSMLIWEVGKVFLLVIILVYSYKVQAKHYQLHQNICWDRLKVEEPKDDLISKHSFQPVPLDRVRVLKDKQSTRKNLGALMKDIVMYGMYIITLGYVVYVTRNDMSYYSTRTVDLIIHSKHLLLVTNYTAFANYMTNKLIPSLHKTEDYNGDSFKHLGITSIYDTKLLGLVQLRQLRVKKDACDIEPVLTGFFSRCKVAYSAKFADHANHSIGWNEFDESTFRETRGSLPWLYSTGRILKITGILQTYSETGYFAYLGRTLNNSLYMFQYLRDNQWFDRYTRVVTISFSLYNANENLFNIVNVQVEIDSTGAFVISYDVDTMELLTSYIKLGWFALVIIVLWLVVLGMFMIQKIIQVKNLALVKYLREYWNIVDLMIIAVAIIVVILNLLRNTHVTQLMKHLEERDHDEFIDFSWVALWQDILSYLTGFLICVSTMRLWKVLRWNYIFRTCENALIRAIRALGALAVVTCVVIECYTAFIYLCIGDKNYGFYTANQAFKTLLISGIGFQALPVKNLLEKNYFIAFMLVLMFWLMFSLFLLNLFLTVIIQYYNIARAYYAYLRIEYGMQCYLKEEIAYQTGRYDLKHYDEKYFSSISTSVVRYPWDIEPISKPKPTPMRLVNTNIISNTQLQVMRHIVEDYIEDSKVSAMRMISRRIVMKDVTPEDEAEADLFHYGFHNNIPKIIPDSRLVEMQFYVNSHYFRMFSRSAAVEFWKVAIELDHALDEILYRMNLISFEFNK